MTRRTFLFLFLLALAARLCFLAARHGFTPPPIPGAEAGVMARSLTLGNGFVTPFGGSSLSTHLPPAYPLLLALFLSTSPTFMFYAALTLSLLASALLPPLTYQLARACCSRPPPPTGNWKLETGNSSLPLLAALLMILCPESLRAAGLIWDESLFVLAVTALLLLLIKLAPTYKSTSLFGFLIGVLSLLNPAATLALPFAWLIKFRTLALPIKKIALHALLLIPLILLPALPWHIRNLTLNPPALVFIRGNLWLEVWSNLNPITFDANNQPHIAHPWPENGTESLERAGHPLTEQQYFAWCRQRSLEKLSHPSILFRHLLTQLNAFWLGPAEATRWHRSPLLFFLAQGLPALLGLSGLLALLTRPPQTRGASILPIRTTLAPLLTFLLIFPLPYYLTGGAARYRHPLDPILYIGLASLLLTVLQKVKRIQS